MGPIVFSCRSSPVHTSVSRHKASYRNVDIVQRVRKGRYSDSLSGSYMPTYGTLCLVETRSETVQTRGMWKCTIHANPTITAESWSLVVKRVYHRESTWSSFERCVSGTWWRSCGFFESGAWESLTGARREMRDSGWCWVLLFYVGCSFDRCVSWFPWRTSSLVKFFEVFYTMSLCGETIVRIVWILSLWWVWLLVSPTIVRVFASRVYFNFFFWNTNWGS